MFNIQQTLLNGSKWSGSSCISLLHRPFGEDICCFTF